MTKEEGHEFFEDHPEFTLNPLNEQLVLIAEMTDDQGKATLRKFESELRKYRSTANLPDEQRQIARRIYHAYIKANRFDVNDYEWTDENSHCCGQSVLFPRLPLPAGLRGSYDLSQCAIQLQLEKRYHALPYEKRGASFLWTCRGCYRKAFHRMEEEHWDGHDYAEVPSKQYTKFNSDYIKCIEGWQDAEDAKEAAAAAAVGA